MLAHVMIGGSCPWAICEDFGIDRIEDLGAHISLCSLLNELGSLTREHAGIPIPHRSSRSGPAHSGAKS
jgi:hypothetical protein